MPHHAIFQTKFRVQDLNTNLIREPFREPVKEEEDAQAREEVSEELFGKLLRALGLDPEVHFPAWWQGSPPREHVRRWRDDLGLSEARILAVAADSRRAHPAPPDGPKALDRAMARAARSGRLAENQVRQTPKARRGTPAPPSAEEMTRFYAALIDGEGYLHPGAISTKVCEILLVRGLLSPERLKMRGVL